MNKRAKAQMKLRLAILLALLLALSACAECGYYMPRGPVDSATKGEVK